MANVKYIKEGNVGSLKCSKCGFVRAVTQEKYYNKDFDPTCAKCRARERILIQFPLGKRFSNWTVIDNTNGTKIKVQCDCSLIKEIADYSLKCRTSRSCIDCGYKGAFKGYKQISLTYFERLRRAAERRNIKFEISIEEIWQLYESQNGKCALTGVSLVLTNSNHFDKHTASLDRIESDIGYFPGNLQWIHKVVNKMKMDFNEKDFINWCTLIAKHNK